MSKIYFEKCPDCGYEYAEAYSENNGEGNLHCNLCSYFENTSDYKLDYFDSEDDWAKTQAEAEAEEIKHGSFTRIQTSKNIIKIIDHLIVYGDDDVGVEIHDLISYGPDFDTHQEFWDFVKDKDKTIIHRIVEGIFYEG